MKCRGTRFLRYRGHGLFTESLGGSSCRKSVYFGIGLTGDYSNPAYSQVAIGHHRALYLVTCGCYFHPFCNPSFSGVGLVVMHGYEPVTRTIKHVNESSNHAPDVYRPPPSATSTSPSSHSYSDSQRQSGTSSLFSESSQPQESPGWISSRNDQFPGLSCHTEPPSTMVATVFGLSKCDAAAAICNRWAYSLHYF